MCYQRMACKLLDWTQSHLCCFGGILCDLDMVNFAACCLVAFKILLGGLRDFWSHGHVKSVTNPQVTVDIVFADILDQVGPGLLLVLQDLSKPSQCLHS